MNEYLKALLKLKKIDDDKAVVDGIFSSANEDRHGDIVVQTFDLKAFKKNPVILDSHDHHNADSVIGKATGLKVVKNKLQGKIQFAVDENPKAKVIFDLIKGGYLNAFSIGFIPKEFDDGNKILKSELLEISVVSVPANADALVQAKAAGVKNLDLLYAKNKIKNKKDDEPAPGRDDDDKSGRDKEEDKVESIEGNEELEKTIFTEIRKEYDNWDETNEEIRFKVKDIAEFEDGSLKKVTMKESFPKIMATVGVLARGDEAIQMLFFPKGEGWTNDDARKWFSQRQRAVIGAPVDEDSISSGKSVQAKVYDAMRKENKVYLNNLNKICNAIKAIGEVEVETRHVDDRAEKRRVINKCLRDLRKIKKD